MVNYALHADETDTSDAKVAHKFFGVRRTEVRIFHQFLMFVRIVQRKVVFGQFFRFKHLLERRFAKRTKSESLLFNFDETYFAKSVPAV